jgi:TRAP transporter 4TM/12TM fusion protein
MPDPKQPSAPRSDDEPSACEVEEILPEAEAAAAIPCETKERLKKAMEKDARSGRKLTGFWKAVAGLLGAAMVVIYFFSVGVKPMNTQYNLGIYVLLTYLMVFISFPAWGRSRQHRPTVIDLLLCAASVLTIGYYMLEFESFNYRSGMETDLDFYVSLAGVLLSLEVSRRVLGWSLTVVGIAFFLYGLFGRMMPQPFTHRGFDLDRLSTTLFMEQDGVFGVMASVLVTYVILFIFFGAFLQRSGVGKFFIDWPLALAGKSTGGPAKVAVIASAFFGSVSGSAIANTVSTGAFTIPLMKRAGFRPHVAGAIEPAASIGGMFMPPIMGAGGFLMAELTNTPYSKIMILAVFPAILYFFAVFSMIHFEAKKMNIRGLEDEQFEPARVVFKRHWFKSAPLVIIVLLMLLGYSPGLSAFWATVACLGISWFDESSRMLPRRLWLIAAGLGAGYAVHLVLGRVLGMPVQLSTIIAILAGTGVMLLHPLDRDWFVPFRDTVVSGAKSTLVIGATVGVIGIVIGTIAITGIGLKFSDIIISLANGNLPISILLIGVASLVLGMGVPVTAAYLITAVLAVPALIEMMQASGIPGHSATSMAIGAHMIVYWFSQDSNITPPVCVAAYAGAAIAGSDPWKTGWTSFKYAKLLYVMPFLFAYDPGLLLEGTLVNVLITFFTCIIGTLAFSALTMGYLIRRTTLAEWILFAVGTFLCYQPYYMLSKILAEAVPGTWTGAVLDALPLLRPVLTSMPHNTLNLLGVLIFITVYAIQKKKNLAEAAGVEALQPA